MNLVRRNFLVRLMSTCFLGIHTPLIVAVTIHLLTGSVFDWETIAFLIAATLLGTGGTLYVLQREIMPVIRVSKALQSFAERREVVAIDHDAQDEIGVLARSAHWAIEKADQMLREKEREAGTDSLTGLPNRRAFLEMARTQAGGSVAILDIDHFKSINDTLGHHTGDYVLNRIAAVVRTALRRGDSLARWGGEEFVILLPEGSPAEAAAVIDRARRAVAAAPLAEGRTVTFSAGVAACSGDVHADLARADRALYRAKNTGRNRIATAEDGADRRTIAAPALDGPSEPAGDLAGEPGRAGV